jgi:hypothetical protein
MTFQQFLEFCKTCSDIDEIYDTIHFNKGLYNAVYDEGKFLGVVFGDDTPEPMRASLEAIGEFHNIPVLSNW